MPTYKIYKKIGNWKLNTHISQNWISLSVKENLDSSTAQKIKKLNQTIENTSFVQKEQDFIEFIYDNNLIIGNQKVKVSEKFHIISFDDFLAFQIVPSRAQLLIEKLLQSKMSIVLFSNFELLEIFNRLQKLSKNTEWKVKLHRIITEHTMIESDEIKELNISAKDVAELDLFKEVSQNSKRIRALTMKLEHFAPKQITARFSDNAVLIYGNHEKDDIIEYLKLIIKPSSK